RDGLDNVVEEEDGEHIRLLGGNSTSGIKKYRGSNSSDGGDTCWEIYCKRLNTGSITVKSGSIS
ncbi:hypothetical protein Tco_1322311, partial [Tanacetum coccineum]